MWKMAKKRVLIVGAGVSGLLANYAFRQHKNVDSVMFEPGRPGAEFLAGGLKYLHRTDEMARMLHDLDIVFTNYMINGGILLHGKIQSYPKCLQSMESDRAERIRQDHWRKTRRTEPGELGQSMNDPEASGLKRALRCNFVELVEKLTFKANIVRQPLVKIEPHRATAGDGSRWLFDAIVLTIPLWLIKRVAYWPVPDAMALRLNLVQIDPVKDRYPKWDYVYTPYTPEGLIHRLSPRDGGFSCEFNGAWTEKLNDKVHSELNFLFPDGWALTGMVKNLNGHLLPLAEKPEWPTHVRPLGRFAKWDPRATSDITYRDAYRLAEEWGWERRHE
jgi:hypothetical protein